jgi:hypothetical protein
MYGELLGQMKTLVQQLHREIDGLSIIPCYFGCQC